jgi:hypothetical protein
MSIMAKAKTRTLEQPGTRWQTFRQRSFVIRHGSENLDGHRTSKDYSHLLLTLKHGLTPVLQALLL